MANTECKVTFPAKAVAFHQCEVIKLLSVGRYAGNVGWELLLTNYI